MCSGIAGTLSNAVWFDHNVKQVPYPVLLPLIFMSELHYVDRYPYNNSKEIPYGAKITTHAINKKCFNAGLYRF
jgi:hypothetical protein